MAECQKRDRNFLCVDLRRSSCDLKVMEMWEYLRIANLIDLQKLVEYKYQQLNIEKLLFISIIGRSLL